jgi:hypothetical protein
VDYQPQGGGTLNFEAWVVMQIVSEVRIPQQVTAHINCGSETW